MLLDPMHPCLSRRELLRTASLGFGAMAFSGLYGQAAAPATASPVQKAKRVIFLFMRGGPSQVDTFDYKPELKKRAGEPLPVELENAGLLVSTQKVMAPPWKFQQHGQSGLWISDLYPQLARHADELCLINSMFTDIPNHQPACIKMHTGAFRDIRPSVGSWILYGLGREAQNLPGFITISPPMRFGGALLYGSGFLPSSNQGVRIGRIGQPVSQAIVGNLQNPLVTTETQVEQLRFAQAMNRRSLEAREVDQALEGVIDSLETAFRMQSAMPEVLNLNQETQETLSLYGIGTGATDNFGRQCLLARRFAEAGVRFIELCHEGWDTHRKNDSAHQRLTAATDRPIAGLLTDLKRRGLLDDTIVFWGGEFGRTSGAAARATDGREHNVGGFTMWMAGGGVRGGQHYGKTEDYGMLAVEQRCDIYDLYATILHLLGLDHMQLTYRYGGRDYRLTDVHGEVHDGMLA